MNIQILWADDEIELLKPQILFLNQKGYEVSTVTNGIDAIDACAEKHFDAIFLDENMPGLTGLETLTRIKKAQPNLPVVMITKSEEENIMEEAIGGQIADYLIKPVKPSQILLALKKIIKTDQLVQQKTTSGYQRDFQKIFMALQDAESIDGWNEIFKNLIYWELNLEKSNTKEMDEVLTMQKKEANAAFFKFVQKHYINWVNTQDGPVMSHNLLQKKIFPHLSGSKPTFMILIDNMRYDQWKVIEPMVAELYRVEEEETFMSILPTATQYSRNAIFSGLMPRHIEMHFPQYWKNDEDEGGKNQFEGELLSEQMKRFKLDLKHSYTKITNNDSGKQLSDNIHNYLKNDFNVIVYNFVDMLSHARTDMDVIRELANDEAAYRSITQSWFRHSPLWDALKKLADKDIQLFLTTDHGTMQVKHASKVLGDRNTSTNLRYKTGKSMKYDSKDVFDVKDPHKALLPRQHISSNYIFAKEDRYFVYQNNYNHYVNHFKNTFQHGGISLEEMVCPIIKLSSK